MIDVVAQVNAAQRRVGSRTLEAGEARAVILTRTYSASVEEVWDAVSNPERIPRWFLPVSGNPRPGGHYQLEGNAGGTIERCDPPRGFDATWEYGGSVSWIELRLSTASDSETETVLQLSHIALIDDDDKWAQFGPGAVGVGWDLGLLGLSQHLETGRAVDPEQARAWSASEAGRGFASLASRRWGEADVAAGAAPAEARAAAERTAAFYTGAALGTG